MQRDETRRDEESMASVAPRGFVTVPLLLWLLFLFIMRSALNLGFLFLSLILSFSRLLSLSLSGVLNRHHLVVYTYT